MRAQGFGAAALMLFMMTASGCVSSHPASPESTTAICVHDIGFSGRALNSIGGLTQEQANVENSPVTVRPDAAIGGHRCR